MIKKQHFLIALFIILNGEIYSQAATLQETVNYINNKLTLFSDEKDKDFIWQFKVEKYGTVKQYSFHQTLLYNLNDIDSIKYIREDNKHFVKLYCKNKNCIVSSLHIGVKEQWTYCTIAISSEIESRKLISALDHLKSLLIHSDPFKK